MKKRYLGSLFLGGLLILSSCLNETVVKEQESLTPISFEKVTLNDRFWLPRLKTQKETRSTAGYPRKNLTKSRTFRTEPIIAKRLRLLTATLKQKRLNLRYHPVNP